MYTQVIEKTYSWLFDFQAVFSFFQLLFLLEFFQPSVPSNRHQGVHIDQFPKLPHHWQLALLLHICSSHTSTHRWAKLMNTTNIWDISHGYADSGSNMQNHLIRRQMSQNTECEFPEFLPSKCVFDVINYNEKQVVLWDI